MILILGGGLAGLSAAHHLRGVPHLVLEAEASPGGLCRTREVGGFSFDYTGHLLHLRDPRAIALVDRILPGAFETIRRRAFIRTRGATLPFPFQANLHGLPVGVVADCVAGFVESLGSEVPEGTEASFRDWSLAVFGRGISEAFLFPYNAKLFRRDPVDMTADWVSWSIPRPTLREVVRGALGLGNEGMGYNPTFRYPRVGGIGIVPEALARGIPTVRCGARVGSVDLDRRTLTLENGERIGWDRLLVTIPLPGFLTMTGDAGLSEAAGRLDWSSVACLNLGVDREGVGDGAHWIYFPDAGVPFYRVGFPTAFARGVAPEGTSSMYVEIAFANGDRPDLDSVEATTLDALRAEGVLRGSDRILVKDWTIIEPGYVVFDRRRSEVLAAVVPRLEARGVQLAGRYGAWTYAYMERAMLDGLEAARRLAG
ncbi:MAG: FAD-dependent oxidoreductase [Acidobacteriia bacterium]|nr:FAD-dependent oxidoreductase [Terriglobia bacterium]